jgi:GxxExxY protein
MKENEIGKIVVDAAVKVHSALGPGLLESVDEAVLAQELERRGLSVSRQVAVSIEYEGMNFDEGFRTDIIVEGKVILELKSVEPMSKVDHKQLFTYLKLKELKPGYLLNFGASLIKDGIKRMINGLDDSKLGVFGSLRESKRNGQAGGDLHSESLRSAS